MRNVRIESPLWRSTLVLLLVATGPVPANSVRSTADIVDENGQPVADASVADFWKANGTGKDQDGKYLDMKIEANVKKFWPHLGEMEPAGRLKVATSGSQGEFTVALPTSSHALLAMDRQHQRAGLLIVPEGQRARVDGNSSRPGDQAQGQFPRAWRGENPGLDSCLFEPAR